MITIHHLVRSLKEKFNNVAELVPGFTQEMLFIVDLMYQIDSYLVEKLNSILKANGLEQVDHDLHAIYRLDDKYKTMEEKEETDMAVKRCFMDVGGFDEPTPKAIRDQWTKYWKLTKSRVIFVHPFPNAELSDLQDLKNQIGVKPEYSEVHEATRFMVDLTIKLKTTNVENKL